MEIYNPNPVDAVDLTKWTVQRFADGSVFGDVISLSGSIAAGDVYVVATEQTAFESAFGATVADQFSTTISGDGNDTYALIKDGVLIDIFGAIGVDGTGQAWEYLDSVATRSAGAAASTSWQSTEWTIAAGASGATPGSH